MTDHTAKAGCPHVVTGDDAVRCCRGCDKPINAIPGYETRTLYCCSRCEDRDYRRRRREREKALRAERDALLAMVEDVRDGMTEARSEGLTAVPLTRLAEIVGDPIDNNHPQEIGVWDVERAALHAMQAPPPTATTSTGPATVEDVIADARDLGENPAEVVARLRDAGLLREEDDVTDQSYDQTPYTDRELAALLDEWDRTGNGPRWLFVGGAHRLFATLRRLATERDALRAERDLWRTGRCECCNRPGNECSPELICCLGCTHLAGMRARRPTTPARADVPGEAS